MWRRVFKSCFNSSTVQLKGVVNEIADTYFT